MARLSIFDLYKIGIGPSSSHTLGPWKAAARFAAMLADQSVTSLSVALFGSLSKTGVGHGTDVAVMMGLEGHDPETFPPDQIFTTIARIKQEKQLLVNGTPVAFDPAQALVFQSHALPFHPNGLTFTATLAHGTTVEETYYSVGGGFITQEHDAETPDETDVTLPFPIDSGQDLIAHTDRQGGTIAEVVYQNELAFHDATYVRQRMLKIWDTMVACMLRGCRQEGILPGGLRVKRRARLLCSQLLQGPIPETPPAWIDAVRQTGTAFSNVNQWLSCFALAVNEENASFGRVVTSPTNGAAGVVPAVLMYYRCFCDFRGDDDIVRFLLTSGQIGCIFKNNATISAAVGGCQAEIGVSSAMAAGGLTALLGGSPQQVLMAAEIAMEHHLGLTCDPAGGLVQIPCIERNTMGAIKAITASHLALSGDPTHAVVSFDVIVKTMWDTAQDMHTKYKETSEGGLSINIPVAMPEC
ncbi:L-serine dehydratase [Catalinimonas alkaloidigena]|uniref:L-serine dehydratase n=1 Tax=Catalinimonas alkaloidigena TaxID=1075417 RepID=A0A1G9T1F0_9BACT|nr:L-serine ammonia-lyase [Catalinimonas alkaloidigena]SDM41554.1 L-serine dehydratase [Catalinimonas alkaloidigena]